MEISTPQGQEPTPEELKELEKLKAIIESAIADGKLTEPEFARIKAAIRADNKVSYEEIHLVRTLIYDKIASGELERVWE
ncbi:hypothetical protein Xen7305DRAFT_00036600 [Xenococcus sp. PCC 7305]|uniref:hypothetical protein n=1 Tax=Xenococcus sp. PCC 7305 TaxID=102125 RepID=UPI0002AD038E|nr:hypothetical protein [Xenococcus sp. PCC 7305]ELS03936.1 hypothetical protein Xen7305DRAFT_00036600 [Xenococcus sp. PCC 7305]